MELDDDTTQTTTWGRALRLQAGLVLAAVPAVVGSGAVADAAGYASVVGPGLSSVPAEVWAKCAWASVVAVSASVLFLGPGLVLALLLGAGRGFGSWMTAGLGLSIPVVSAAAWGGQSAVGGILRGGEFAAVVLGCEFVCFGLFAAALARGRQMAWPLALPGDRLALASAVLVPAAFLLLHSPKVYWENFNSDGAHAFESSRQLLVRPTPFWPAAAGPVADFPGMNTVLFTYPASWYIRLFGGVEAAVRLPFVLYLPVLFGGVLAVAGAGRRWRPGLPEIGCVWLALVTFGVVMAWSATYSPYSADLALPGTQYALMMACFLGVVLSFVRGEVRWGVFYTLLTLTAGPNGSLLIALWLLAAVLVWVPRPWRRVVVFAAALVGCQVALTAVGAVLPRLGLPAPGEEHGLLGLLTKFTALRLTDWSRFAYCAVPCGLLPAFALFAWPWLDRAGRAVSVLTLLYFAFFYVQAFVALHYFVPVMVLPVVVLWRTAPAAGARTRGLICGAAAVAGLAALAWSLPERYAIYTQARVLGDAIEDRTGGYEASEAESFSRSHGVLVKVFPRDDAPTVPAAEHGGSPLIWSYYAHHADGRTRGVNYVVQTVDDPPPAGMKRLTADGRAVVYVADEAVWTGHRRATPPLSPGSAVYFIPGTKLFRYLSPDDDREVLRVADLLERLGFDRAGLKQRFGPH